MDRRCPRLLLIIAIISLTVLSGCVGKSTPDSETGGVQTVSLNPSSIVSIELGRVQTFTASARNSSGGNVFTTIHFLSGCTDQLPCAPISITPGGVMCAGRWDALNVVCTPGVAGIATVVAEAEGVSSPPTTVYVHEHIQSIRVTPIGIPTDNCFSQATTWNYEATAFGANGVDITNTVGPINWSSTNGSVLTITPNNNLPRNQVETTANLPGVAKLFATNSGTTSTPVDYTTCLVHSIMLRVLGGTGDSATVSAGSTKTIEATVVDTLGVTLSRIPLTWSTSNPKLATVSTTGVVTARQNAGAVNISASCTPPTCNIGVLPGLPVYAGGGTLPNGQTGFGAITVHITTTTPPAATAWIATKDCGDNFNCTSVMFPVAAADQPVGPGVELPYTPNSMTFTPSGSRAYLGSEKGLMFVDFGGQSPTVNTVSQATTPCNVAVCGKPLTISPDGNLAVVSDTVTQPNQVYIFDAAHPNVAPTNLLIPGATAAAYSPDQMKLFILSDTGRMYVFSTVDALTSVPISATAHDLEFAAGGSLAYVAGSPVGTSVSGFATCNAANLGTSVSTAGAPLMIRPLPDITQTQLDAEKMRITQDLVSLAPPNIQVLTAQFNQNTIDDPSQLTCNVPTLSSFTARPAVNLGQGNFTPLYMQVTGDGSRVIVVAQNIPAVLIFDVEAGTTSAIPLANNASPLAASASQDGTQVFVASCDADHANPNTCGSIHIVNTQSGGDIQQAVYTNINTNDSMCSNLDHTAPACLPNLIAVRPQ